ncbi:MAG: Xaa-Pro peptidase family protein, partial [Proteobacteria bacterium]|nr:Xaa-Pro peptidase family protein [Pseudomonadota bacterium]
MATFTIEEYRTRIHATKERMSNAGIELLIAADPANMNYLTGYDGWSFYTPQVVCVALTEEEPICIVRGMDRAGGLVTAWIAEHNMVGYPDHYVQAAEIHPMDYIGAYLSDRGLARGRVGVEMDAYYYSARAHAALTRALPDAELTDATNLINWIRVIKSNAEIGFMQDAARLVEAAMRAGIDAVRPGVRQCDAVAGIYNAQIRGTTEFGGEYTSIVPMLPTGAATSTPHLTWSSESFKTGEATILELAGCHNRYHCPMSRTVHLGKPPT